MGMKKKSLKAQRAGKKCPHGFRKGSAKCRKHPKRRSHR